MSHGSSVHGELAKRKKMNLKKRFKIHRERFELKEMFSQFFISQERKR